MTPKTYPKISIITVAKNSAETIADCVRSVRDQDYPAEHVFVDGCSSDDTLDIIKRHSSENSRIVSEPDDGIYDAMNKGLALAEGDVVGTLNSDDYYANSRVLSCIAQVFQDLQIEACYGDLAYVDRVDTCKVIRYWRSRPYCSRLFFNGWMPPHPTFFVRRSIYENYGGFRTDLGTAADYELMLRFLLKRKINAHYVPYTIVFMRTGGASNISVKNRLKANRMDKMAWKVNGLKPMPWTFVAKPLSKVTQFLSP